jgi:HEPN domain-containing protein
VVMKPESIEAHCNQGTRLESAIARQGRLLAGAWTPPSCRIEDLDVDPEDIGQNLDTATRDLCSVFLALCNAAFKDLLYVPNVVEYSQQAAEMLAKTIIAGFGLSPATVHDLDALATQLENAYRGRTHDAEERRLFAASIRELDGNTRAAHVARYHAAPVEAPERTAERIGRTLRLQTMWLRWYAERNPEMQGAAMEAAREIADAAGLIEEMRGFDRIDPELRAQVRAWGADGRSIATAFDRGSEQAP